MWPQSSADRFQWVGNVIPDHCLSKSDGITSGCRQDSESRLCWEAFSSFSPLAHHWWDIQCVSIYTRSAETRDGSASTTLPRSSNYMSINTCVVMLLVIAGDWVLNAEFLPPQTEPVGRPAASSTVPRAWIQRGRYNQWDRKPHWYPYSHRGRQCSPLTTHVPSGVRNP